MADDDAIEPIQGGQRGCIAQLLDGEIVEGDFKVSGSTLALAQTLSSRPFSTATLELRIKGSRTLRGTFCSMRPVVCPKNG
jgi:hypothetical protein